MKGLKYAIFIVVIIIIVIIATLLVVININSNNPLRPDEREETDFTIDTSKLLRNIQDRDSYYVVQILAKSYYNDLTQFNMKKEDVIMIEEELDNIDELVAEEIKAVKTKVYNYLDIDYIKQNNITIENIQEKLGNYNNIVTIIDEINFAEVNENVRVYFIQGKNVNKETKESTKFNMTISTDSQNRTFEVYPNSYKYNLKIGEELNIKKDKIDNKTYNKYTYKIINDETYCLDMVRDLKDRLMYDVDGLYNKINGEYRNAKFSSMTEFRNYITKQYNKLININITKYQTLKRDNYTQYVCMDDYNNNYIFRETAPMKYEAILDTYTIDIPEFVTKYNASTPQEKVILNLNKFMLALNDKDYKTAYNMLAPSFRTNNFSTLAEFEEYIKTNLFENNKFEYTKFGSEAGTYYTYEVKITDASRTKRKRNYKNIYNAT